MSSLDVDVDHQRVSHEGEDQQDEEDERHREAQDSGINRKVHHQKVHGFR